MPRILRPLRSPSAPTGALLVDLIVDQQLIHDSGIRPLPAKIMVTFRRRHDLSRTQAQAHWRGRHVEVGFERGATDFLRLYFQNHVIADNRVERPEHDYDGLPEFWVDQDALAQVLTAAPAEQSDSSTDTGKTEVQVALLTEAEIDQNQLMSSRTLFELMSLGNAAASYADGCWGEPDGSASAAQPRLPGLRDLHTSASTVVTPSAT